MKPGPTEVELRKIANLVYQDPQRAINRSIGAIFVCKVLVFVWPFRLSDIGAFGFILGLVIIFVGIDLFNAMVKQLQKVADTTRAKAPSLETVAFIPVMLAFLIRRFETSSANGRIPFISILVDVSLILMAIVGIGIYAIDYACQNYPRQYAPFAPTREPDSEQEPAGDSKPEGDHDQSQD